MKKSIIISFGIAFTTCSSLVSASVADLEALQAANPNIVYQYTFEGNTEAEQLSQKVGTGTPDMKQTLFEPARVVDFLTPGYDSSTRFADFSAFASGAKGDGLQSETAVTFSTSGSVEFLFQLGTVSANNFMIAGDGTGSDDRWRPLSYDGTAAYTTIGNNTKRELIGGSTGIAYNVGDWYYVAQSWNIVGGSVTIDAWVANLSDANPALTKVVDGLSNAFSGDGSTTLYLGSVNGSLNFADGGLDSLAIYNTALGQADFQAHFNSIPEPSSVALIGGIMGMFVVVRKRRFRR